MNEESDRLVLLVEKLLETTGINSRRLTSAQEPVNLDIIIASASSTLKPLIDKKHIHYSEMISDNLSIKHSEKDKIQSIIKHLLDNAVKFTPENGEISDFGASGRGPIIITSKRYRNRYHRNRHSKDIHIFLSGKSPFRNCSGGGIGIDHCG